MDTTALINLIREGGPVFGPLLFFVAVALTWGYHGLLRQVSIRQNRFALLLLDKDYVTLRELLDYGCLDEVGGVTSDLVRMKRGTTL